ncbi:MAG: MOSC domain-containing protein [Candidatus Acidiferrum sp.]
MPRVVALFRAPKRGSPMQPLPEVIAVEQVGFAGCAHARPGGKRQVLLADGETLDALQLFPGMIRENITTEGLNVNGLKEGDSLRVGEAHLEVTMVCTPCSQMDDLRQGLQREIRGRRGMLCRVLKSGVIRQGDGIERLT